MSVPTIQDTLFALSNATNNSTRLLACISTPISVAVCPYEYYQWFIAVDPIATLVSICLLAIFATFTLSEITGNCSQVDRVWSILPALYAWTVASRPLWTNEDWNQRVVIMALLATCWAVRLTYNFWRKGGYNAGDEDYRWPIVRTWMSPFFFHFFNFFFIALYQNVLIFLFSGLPVYGAYKINTQLNEYDLLVVALWLALWTGEIVADQQQWHFQNRKKELLLAAAKYGGSITGEYQDGFISSGLWAYSRHPNFFCEVSIWWTYSLFTATTHLAPNWLMIGGLMLNLLFLGSTSFTEQISSRKYPRYALYQESISMLIPWFPKDWRKKLD